ncbi:hypothetical protein CCHL11_05172 [Colletotrichum chlorophyti]|uniref:ubiquitinyl hydrolase 1 n=1 Tax=Colletotrichum chlorophyti TaxID=708187 RepID=A0A1Q8S238_9PEZI|nr:hypothetical protein CCHL11_05172 [Colletotrichum chlorophyti]
MDIVITLLLRVCTLTATNKTLPTRALAALAKAREICVRWVVMLRAETYKASDMDTAQRCQQYALCAAILCKRTFVIHVNQFVFLDPKDLQIFIECCITVQDNLVVEVGALPQVLQHAVVADTKLSYRLSSLVCRSIISSPETFRLAIRAVWPEPEDRPRKISSLRCEEVAWVVCDIYEHDGWDEIRQMVHFNTCTGLLLVDHRPLGRLPKPPEHTEILTELFGEQALLTRPSNIRGMEYTLCIQPRLYRIDVGYESSPSYAGPGSGIIVRATKGQQYLQLIPRQVFQSEQSWDLPGPLVEGCFHWLDLRTGKVFIIQKGESKDDIWNINQRNWTLDIRSGVCSRPTYLNAKDRIVDTYSPLFTRVSRIFQGFEQKQHLLVYQPTARHLQVELRRHQLLFYVNPRQLLESPQLGSEIDSNQDAGTWYGLESKLVFRNPRDLQQRSILIPLGELHARRQGDTMLVNTLPCNIYGRFVINKTLGRIDCAAEPLLLYFKALLHAYTSSVFPDPLTGRTGTEEALQFLSSGVCQPWSPLNAGSVGALSKISQLTPRHEYYPTEMKSMKIDYWADSLTESVQHERFRPLVEQILAISAELQTFALVEVDQNVLAPSGDVHLSDRSRIRRQIFERSFDNTTESPKLADATYSPRDCPLVSNTRHCQVLEIVHLLRTWPEKMATTTSLAQKLSQSNLVGGFGDIYEKVSLNDRLNIDLVNHWGSLVRSCREYKSPFALMFLLAPFSYSTKAEIGLVRTLAAFAIFEELKMIELPIWTDYANFQPNQVPQLQYLTKIIEPFKTPAPKDDGDELQQFASAKQLRRIRDQKTIWENRADDDCKFLAMFLLSQWPCIEPDVAKLSKPLLVDIEAALQVVRVEWKRVYQNMDLSKHLDEVQSILNRRHSETKYEAPCFIASEDIFQERLRGGEIPFLRPDLMKKTFPSLLGTSIAQVSQTNLETAKVTGAVRNSNAARHPAHIHQPIRLPSYAPRGAGTNVLAPSWMSSKTALIPSNDATAELKQIVSELSSSKSLVRQKYGDDLQRSLDAFVTRRPNNDSPYHIANATVTGEGSSLLMGIQSRFTVIEKALEAQDEHLSASRISWLQAGHLWPAVTTITLLEQLRSTATPIPFGKFVRENLIDFGLAITSAQRHLRINDASMRGDAGRYSDEMANNGHSNWHPSEHPDWLLLEIEANLMIRPEQVDVALATISPASGSNSVLQMNMGQGVFGLYSDCVV